jgi:exosortase/archaeosortase family protein
MRIVLNDYFKGNLLVVYKAMKDFVLAYKNHFLFRATWLLVVYFGFYYSPWMQGCNIFLTENTATTSAWVISSVLGIPVSVVELDLGYKWHINGNHFAGVKIAHPCNAFELYCLYVGFIVCISGIAIRRKWIFALLGVVVIYVFNFSRVVALFLISGKWPQFFDFMHKYLFQAIAYLIMFELWYWLLQKRSYGQ